MSRQLQDWLKRTTAEERETLAANAGTSVGYIWQLAGGHRKASLGMAKRLQEASFGELTIQGLRPDIFGDQKAA
ncbi:hypothetical protein [Salinicola sp. DM10]|uniref:hypothetical protein n=1 Tax=Salinicola sp. DM10 TaxID=2815721 RepID=UPI001A8E02AB|nr:hypothetical protein [Salinicola sp. DM10]MCE3025758.1 helix-turn-helix domain-containing protein [Salinicola sp. DM10]